ncbi:MAG: glycosyl transferase, partial [Candidatus Sedimenticola endophacoides]
MPRLSILLPFRNAGATLPSCLDSITAQCFGDFELLAVNDHSNHASRRLVAALAVRDRRVRLLDNPGRGLVSALNHGLRSAATELIARMDADDLMHPERLERQYTHLFRHPRITLLGCAAELFPRREIQAGYREYMRWQNRCLTPRQIADQIYIESPFAHPSVIFRKQAVIELGGYREGPFPEDYDLWLRLHHAGLRMEKLPDKLLRWRDYPQRTSRTDPRCSRGRPRVMAPTMPPHMPT